MRFVLHEIPPMPVYRRLLLYGAVAITGTVMLIFLLNYLANLEPSRESIDPRKLHRRVFYKLPPGGTLSVKRSDINKTLLTSLIARFRDPSHFVNGCEIEIRTSWIDDNGQPVSHQIWRRAMRPRPMNLPPLVADQYFHPDGGVISNPANLELAFENAPPNISRIDFTLQNPQNIEVYARFYSPEDIAPGTSIAGTSVMTHRQDRLLERSGFPSEIAPPGVLDLLRSWRWQTLGATSSGSLEQQELLRRDLTPQERLMLEQALALRPPAKFTGTSVGPGFPLAYYIPMAGRYELQITAPQQEIAEFTIETRTLGKLPTSEKILFRGALIWAGTVAEPTTLVVRKALGSMTPLQLVRLPDDSTTEARSFIAPADLRTVAFFTGPSKNLLRTLTEGQPTLPFGIGEPPDTLIFDWSEGAQAAQPLLRFRIRAVGIPPPATAKATLIIHRAAGKDRIQIPLSFPAPELERLLDAWVPARVTGSVDLFAAVPPDASRIELTSDVPCLVVAFHTLPQIAPFRDILREIPDRSLCYLVETEELEDARVWHILRPTNENDYRSALAVAVVNLQKTPIRTPDPDRFDPEAARTIEEADVVAHAGRVPMLWPAHPLGSVEKKYRRPWRGKWPAMSYRAVSDGEAVPDQLLNPWPEPVEIIRPNPDRDPSRSLAVRTEVLRPGAATWWINLPARVGSDPRDDGLRFLHGYRATAEQPLELVVDRELDEELWLTLSAQPEGMGPQRVLLQVDINPIEGTSRPPYWLGNMSHLRERMRFTLRDGPAAKPLTQGALAADSGFQARVRIGPDFRPGRYRVQIRPIRDKDFSDSVILSAAWSSDTPIRIVPGAALTFRVDEQDTDTFTVIGGLGLTFDLVQSTGVIRRLEVEKGVLKIPPEGVTVIARNPGLGSIPVSLIPLYSGLPPELTPIPRALAPMEERSRWQLLKKQWSAATIPGPLRVEFAWDGDGSPPTDPVLIGGRSYKLQWTRATYAFSPSAPKAKWWISYPIELMGPPSLQVEAVGLWFRWMQRVGPPDSVSILTPGRLFPGAHAPFISRSWRATGIWLPCFVPPAHVLSHVMYITAPEFRDIVDRIESPDLTLYERILQAGQSTNQIELVMPEPAGRGSPLPITLWRPIVADHEMKIKVGDLAGLAKYGSVQLWFEGVSIEGIDPPGVQILVDGRPAWKEMLHTTRGHITVPNIPAGDHPVELRMIARPGGQWRIFTIDVPGKDDIRVVSAWVNQDRTVVVPMEGIDATSRFVLEVLNRQNPKEWQAWTVFWGARLPWIGWLPLRGERYFVAPHTQPAPDHKGTDGSEWFSRFWLTAPIEAGQEKAVVLFGPMAPGTAVRAIRTSSEPLPVSPYDDVRKGSGR